MKKLIFMLVLITSTMTLMGQTLNEKIGEAKSIAKSIQADLTKIDLNKELPKAFIDKITLFNQKVSFLKTQIALNPVGACLTNCGVQHVACIYTCGGSGSQCLMFCQLLSDMCVLGCYE